MGLGIANQSGLFQDHSYATLRIRVQINWYWWQKSFINHRYLYGDTNSLSTPNNVPHFVLNFSSHSVEDFAFNFSLYRTPSKWLTLDCM